MECDDRQKMSWDVMDHKMQTSQLLFHHKSRNKIKSRKHHENPILILNNTRLPLIWDQSYTRIRPQYHISNLASRPQLFRKCTRCLATPTFSALILPKFANTAAAVEATRQFLEAAQSGDTALIEDFVDGCVPLLCRCGGIQAGRLISYFSSAILGL